MVTGDRNDTFVSAVTDFLSHAVIHLEENFPPKRRSRYSNAVLSSPALRASSAFRARTAAVFNFERLSVIFASLEQISGHFLGFS